MSHSSIDFNIYSITTYSTQVIENVTFHQMNNQLKHHNRCEPKNNRFYRIFHFSTLNICKRVNCVMFVFVPACACLLTLIPLSRLYILMTDDVYCHNERSTFMLHLYFSYISTWGLCSQVFHIYEPRCQRSMAYISAVWEPFVKKNNSRLLRSVFFFSSFCLSFFLLFVRVCTDEVDGRSAFTWNVFKLFLFHIHIHINIYLYDVRSLYSQSRTMFVAIKFFLGCHLSCFDIIFFSHSFGVPCHKWLQCNVHVHTFVGVRARYFSFFFFFL